MGYRLQGQIETSLRISNNHSSVVAANNTLHLRGYNLQYFTSADLVDLWANDVTPMMTKILASFWWGRISHYNQRKVFSSVNLDLLSVNAPAIESRLLALSSHTDLGQFHEDLLCLFDDLLAGIYHIDGVSVSFLTKLFHFWFYTHPVVSRPGFLPIVCDKWMIRAVYADMVDNARSERVNVFRKYKDGVVLKRPVSSSYWNYIEYFNARAERMGADPFYLERILFSNRSRVLADDIIAAENVAIFLPPWVAGRFDAENHVAIMFNNLTGQNYLFENDSASIIGEILSYDYWKCIFPSVVGLKYGYSAQDILAFAEDLKEEWLILDKPVSDREVFKKRSFVRREKKSTIKKAGGVEHLPTIFETVEIDYRDKIKEKGIPSTVSIELTYGCNECCIHCYNPCSPRRDGIAKKVAKEELSLSEYERILDDLSSLGVTNILFTGGDPFIKKDFLKILRYAHEKKFAISIYTNGQVLADRREVYDAVLKTYPHSIGLSLYSMDATIHDGITRIKGSLSKTVAVAKKLSRDGITLQVKCPIMKNNQKGYSRVRTFASRLGAVPEFEVNITAGVDGDRFASNNLRLSEKEMRHILKDPIIPLSSERQNVDRVKERGPEMQFCGAGINTANITPTGDVYPCMSFPLTCGDLKTDSFSKIWSCSSELRRIRRLNYGMSDCCGRESYCKYCNRCIGQSFVEHGVPENKSEDNCFIARIREQMFLKDNSASFNADSHI